jgi:hypothetical protein
VHPSIDQDGEEGLVLGVGGVVEFVWGEGGREGGKEGEN